MTIRTMMLDLHSARIAFWQHQHVVYSYQEIWQMMRNQLANCYHSCLATGTPPEDNHVTIQVHGTNVGIFEIK